MNPAPLLKKANQIAEFFSAQPDRQQAVADMATHLANTWTPAMRSGLQAAVVVGEVAPLVREALAELVVRGKA